MAHILVYPIPSSGHIIPFLDLTKSLLNRGLTITIAITTNNLHLLYPFLSSYSSTQLHHVALPPFESSSSRPGLVARTRFLRDAHCPILLKWFRSHSSPPVAIISDFFLGWTYHLASELGLPRLVFSTSGAFAFSVSTHTWRDQPQNDHPENSDDFVVSFPSIPNCPSYPWWHLNHIYRMPRGADWEFQRDGILANMASWGIIFNSCTELERVYIDHMKQEFGSDRVWAVGPVLPLADVDSANRGGASSVPCHDVLTWLDSRKDNSVVYVAFGSRAMLTCQQMAELAAGLEKSGVNFILCVRQQSDDESILPEGFEDRTTGRGLIIKGWAPQVAILRHHAVGAFVTHCGWNSTLEGLSCGIVMLTWPMGADQFTNAQLVVDQLKVGIRVGESTKKIPESDELVKILTNFVEENSSKRMKARGVQKALLNAIKGGSSEANLDALVQSLNQLQRS